MTKNLINTEAFEALDTMIRTLTHIRNFIGLHGTQFLTEEDREFLKRGADVPEHLARIRRHMWRRAVVEGKLTRQQVSKASGSATVTVSTQVAIAQEESDKGTHS